MLRKAYVIPLLSSGVCSLLSSMPGFSMLMFGRASDFHGGGGGGGDR